MVSSYLEGGLGNYMFQIGAAVSLAKDYNDVAVFDFNDSRKVHSSIHEYRYNIFSHVATGTPKVDNIYRQPYFSYDPIPYQHNLKLYGYFQSEKFLNKQVITDLYKIPYYVKEYVKTKYSKINFSRTTSLHVRRGDYLKLKDKHPVQPLSYYLNAISLFNGEMKFLIFSDDIEWCRNSFTGDRFIFLENEKDYIDLWIMSLCRNNIIANSSFSWWGAWLNSHTDKIIIAPKLWFGYKKKLDTKDLIPSSWTVL